MVKLFCFGAHSCLKFYGSSNDAPVLIAKGLMLFNSHFRSFNMPLFYRFNCHIIDGHAIKLFSKQR